MKATMAILAAVLTAGACFALPPYAGDERTKDKTGIQAQEQTRSAVTVPLALPSLAIPSMAVDKLEVTGIGIAALPVDKIETRKLEPQIENIRKALKALDALMLDRRNALRDSNLFAEADSTLKKWIDIYMNPWPPVSEVELPEGVRMIAEVRMPQSREQAEILERNIGYRKKQGYNAVLMTFDGTEEIEDLAALAGWLKEQNLGVWFAFGARENLKESVFADPEILAQYVQVLASLSDGFLGHWRRTSSHLFIQDQPYMDYLAYWARIGNPEIPVLGEAYFGETAEIEGDYDWLVPFGSNREGIPQNLLFRMARNGSGYLIVNLSTANIDVEAVMKSHLNRFPKPKYVLITGPKVYFLTTHKTPTTYEQDLASIDRIAARWLKAGCRGVIVTHGDGHESGKVTDNMSVMPYTEIKK